VLTFRTLLPLEWDVSVYELGYDACHICSNLFYAAKERRKRLSFVADEKEVFGRFARTPPNSLPLFLFSALISRKFISHDESEAFLPFSVS